MGDTIRGDIMLYEYCRAYKPGFISNDTIACLFDPTELAQLTAARVRRALCARLISLRPGESRSRGPGRQERAAHWNTTRPAR